MRQRRYEELVQKPELFQLLTSVTVEEFGELVEPFEAGFREYMAEWTLEGKRRKNRAYVSYANSPLPTPEERLLFLLSYLKENPTQSYHGLLYGMSQGKMNKWLHSLLPALRTALREMGDAPARSFADLLQRLGQVPEGEPEVEVELEPSEPATQPGASPLLPTMAPSGQSPARSTPSTNSATTVARRASTRSRTCSL